MNGIYSGKIAVAVGHDDVSVVYDSLAKANSAGCWVAMESRTLWATPLIILAASWPFQINHADASPCRERFAKIGPRILQFAMTPARFHNDVPTGRVPGD